MTTDEKIMEYLKELFDAYSINWNEYVYGLIGEEEYDPSQFLSRVGRERALLAAEQMLGVPQAALEAQDTDAGYRWDRKYSFFAHLTRLNHEYRRTFYGEGAEDYFLLERLFSVNLEDRIPKRYHAEWIALRLAQQLKETDKSVPGTFHEGANITKLQIQTKNFCHYSDIKDMMKSFFQMVKRLEALFFAAWDRELGTDEILEYNMLVSTLGVRDICGSPSSYLHYNTLRATIPFYRQEGEKKLFNFVKLRHDCSFRPWRCAEFSEDRELVQQYVNIFPEAKRLMREFAMEVSCFCCSFVWSDAKPIQFSPEEEEEFAYIDKILGQKPVALEERAKERTTIYVPKTREELNGDDRYIEMLSTLCSPPKMGGVTLPKPGVPNNEIFSRRIRRLGLPYNDVTPLGGKGDPEDA